MTIAAILERKGDVVSSVDGSTPVRDVVALLAEKRIGCVPVVADGKVAGIFSERDLVYRIAEQGAAVLDQPVSAVMTAPALTSGVAMPVLTALSLMTRRRIRHLPVVEHGKMIGFVSIGDLVKFRIENIEAEAAQMRDYIQSA